MFAAMQDNKTFSLDWTDLASLLLQHSSQGHPQSTSVSHQSLLPACPSTSSSLPLYYPRSAMSDAVPPPVPRIDPAPVYTTVVEPPKPVPTPTPVPLPAPVPPPPPPVTPVLAPVQKPLQPEAPRPVPPTQPPQPSAAHHHGMHFGHDVPVNAPIKPTSV